MCEAAFKFKKKKAIKSYQKIKIRSPPGATTEISKMSSHIFPPKRRKTNQDRQKNRVYDTDLSSLLISKWNGWPWNIIKVERQQLQIPFRRDGSTWLLLQHGHTREVAPERRKSVKQLTDTFCKRPCLQLGYISTYITHLYRFFRK